MNDLTRRARAAATVLADAEAHGLPQPTGVDINPIAIKIAVDTLTDLAEWSLYLEEPIQSQRFTGDNRLMHHQIRGHVLDQEIRVWTNSVYTPAAGSLDEAFDQLAERASA